MGKFVSRVSNFSEDPFLLTHNFLSLRGTLLILQLHWAVMDTSETMFFAATFMISSKALTSSDKLEMILNFIQG